MITLFKKQRFLFSLFLFISFLGGCNVAQVSENTKHDTAQHPTKKMQLLGSWHVTNILDKAIVKYTQPSLTFTDNNQVFGSASCNNFTTHFTLNDKKLTIQPSATTRKMCPELMMKQEGQFLQVLTNVTSFEIKNDAIEFFDQSHKVLFKAIKRVEK